jgi:hypothetical protein
VDSIKPKIILIKQEMVRCAMKLVTTESLTLH